MIKHHKDLEVWQKSVELAGEIYRLTREFPADEKYGLTSQMRRAAVSVASNIAEGAARKTGKEFSHFLFIAAGSASELDTQIEIVKLLNLKNHDNLVVVQQRIAEVARMLKGLIRSLENRR